MVLTATTAILRSPPASVEPGLNPNQPKARINVPITAIGILCAGIALGDPFLLYFPRRGPSIHAPTNAITPPVKCTTDEPAKSTCP